MTQSGPETLAALRVSKTDNLYRIVDCLNRTLKEKDLMFGLALDQEDEKTAIFTIYET
ncbi:YpmA family protein [Virgibacillus sp. MSP4-1]|uniref:YpmA family protein n=1 Tax=Virgibacillus sp. MSP4-1 TaxID=2700081 RepID=UPI0003A465F3|nr:YpmA family protein [Virgibacillus sp. MSP4-1]QHS22560.1 YpmA family protein [Virgibacillus sp. MSP4-1]